MAVLYGVVARKERRMRAELIKLYGGRTKDKKINRCAKQRKHTHSQKAKKKKVLNEHRKGELAANEGSGNNLGVDATFSQVCFAEGARLARDPACR